MELKHRTLSVTVTPTQATIIFHFQERKRWTIDELSTATQVPKTVLRRKITFWQTQVMEGGTKGGIDESSECVNVVQE